MSPPPLRLVFIKISTLNPERKAAFLNSTISLLRTGLDSADGAIARGAVITIANLARDKTTASCLLDDHHDLVRALVNTFGVGGVSQKFR